MAVICYSGPISVVPTNEQLFEEKRTCTKFQIDISKTEGQIRVYTDSARYADRLCDVSFGVLQALLQTHVQGIKMEGRMLRTDR